MANDKEMMVIFHNSDYLEPKLEPGSNQELLENNSIESEEISEIHTVDFEIKEEFDELVVDETFPTQKSDLGLVQHKIKDEPNESTVSLKEFKQDCTLVKFSSQT